MRVCNWLLALFFGLVYLIPSSLHLLWQPDETRYAEISREMLARGDWVVPHFMGVRYFEKPVAGYWMNNISQWLFGHNNFAVRFGSSLSIALSALLVYWLASRILNDRRGGYLATIIYLSSVLVFSIGGYAILDPILTLWVTAAMASFYLTIKATNNRQKLIAYILLGFASGMGFLTKGFLALAIPVISVLPYVITQKRLKELFIFGPMAIIAAGLISLPWVLAIHWQEPDYWRYFFWVEHVQRFAEQNAQHKAPFWYYFPILLGGTLPWLALLPGALFKGWKERKQQPELFYLLGWMVMPFLFFSIAKGKLPTYILPCFAPLAILMASWVQGYIQSGSTRALKTNAVINTIFGIVGVVAIWVMSSDVLPNARVFLPAEWSKAVIGMICFGCWALVGIITFTSPLKRWSLAAAAPVILALLYGYAIPQQVMDSKQPQAFVSENISQLQNSRYILAETTGIASGIAWELNRDDVILYDVKGEVSYGLDYPDTGLRYIPANLFPDWLAKARQQGNVSLVIRLGKGEAVDVRLPKADSVVQNQRTALLFYKQTEQ
ncbi:lipid IV(A) 4-amino-4-deoxy-L-arabinosyltransferase [Pragia fontium]|uniref:Undecaprenyl phosphate-alpha-4-amino-4-deoxy-L-arabinose arabinosyl transferase n=1 Tax=Pragia fontium DSM 5563 = ATCC 49100 TaxID=1122977 RepID=A0AAJ4WDP4_9GAMM|nr:lipid IV(A) 4-amino-4-deoxy-L-arabinosyltransferase [Pragia fontium]SFD48955.1 4-amino-4-deoxy-L-arabinose transferase [Pragia fontium DSM 5563 = ATCC 49100]VEJ56736.1 Undecaprenyl phosphate-alpha-4-amino-4-deoxy-L-arabinose arabinosyl transferase [Pragia fontium]